MKEDENGSVSLDAATHDLLDYCSEHNVYISPKIAPRRVSGRGLGMYCTQPIHKGDKLIDVPVAALLTNKSIPYDIVSPCARKTIPVHAQLATYLTFLATRSDGGSNPHARWMATWPELRGFLDSMPMLWPERALEPSSPQETEPRASKRQKYSNHNNSSRQSYASVSQSVLPAPLIGSWSGGDSSLTSTLTSDSPSLSKPAALVGAQRQKLAKHIQHASMLLSHILTQPATAEASPTIDITNPTCSLYWTFVRMWSCVNSRSFYYHPAPGRRAAPSDSSEAIALAPGMDLFNHTDSRHCGVRVHYDKDGYHMTAKRDYDVGEEVLLSYGAHTNDVLWTEYGFLPDGNEDDAVRIDSFVVLQDQHCSDIKGRKKMEDEREGEGGTSQRAPIEMLADAGYLGDFWLKKQQQQHDGDDDKVCYRTEVAAWWKVLPQSDLEKVIQGACYPSPADKVYARHKAQLQQWLAEIAGECEQRIKALEDMSSKEKAEIFGDLDEIMVAQGVGMHSIVDVRAKRVECRHALCLRRWEQIRELSVTSAPAQS